MPVTTTNDVCLRDAVTADDRDQVRDIVAATGFFSAAEVEIAVELVDERLAKGDMSGYFFVFAEAEGHTVGYACYGPIAGTLASYDLYWIAVRPTAHRMGIGRRLMDECERRIQQAGGTQVYIDTSNRPQYVPTRGFYERCGYKIAAILDEFYGPNDDKVIFVKRLRP